MFILISLIISRSMTRAEGTKESRTIYINLLYSIPGLRKSQREGRSQIDYSTELVSDNA